MWYTQKPGYGVQHSGMLQVKLGPSRFLVCAKISRTQVFLHIASAKFVAFAKTKSAMFTKYR